MAFVKFLQVFYDSASEPPYRDIRDVVWALTTAGWKCESVDIRQGQATAWLFNSDCTAVERGPKHRLDE